MKLRRIAVLLAGLLLGFMLTMLATPSLRETSKSFITQQIPVLREPVLNASREPLVDRLAAKGFSKGQPVFLRLFKQDSRLELWMQRADGFELFQTYAICKWSGDLGPKLQEGDGQSPEGFYAISTKQLLPTSRYYRALNTGFPNAYDAALNRTGSVLMIHGSCVSIGCYAMTDAGIDDIYTLVEAALQSGQPEVPVHIFPFQMTAENLRAQSASPWLAFWTNLAEGNALFEQTRMPPKVFACGGRYVFGKATGECEMVKSW